MRRLVVLILVSAVAAGAAGCGGTHFAKTRFALHAGLAFGAFHHWIYTPFREGAFRKGAPHRGRTIAKAVAAAAFTIHELRLARRFAAASRILRPLAGPLGAVAVSAVALPALLRGGGGGGLLNRINDRIHGISSRSAASGHPITERVVPVGG